MPADKIRVILGEGYDVPLADLEPDAETSVEPTTAEGWYGMTTSATPDPGPAHGRRRNPLRELIRQTTPRSASAPRAGSSIAE